MKTGKSHIGAGTEAGLAAILTRHGATLHSEKKTKFSASSARVL